mmetsp:Transcript_15432/g.33242  ORF Transcript_15432/g.33242 Transcript_15432/m.33242 type:complete len:215 (-) Transcript_15432:1161-1805(-)
MNQLTRRFDFDLRIRAGLIQRKHDVFAHGVRIRRRFIARPPELHGCEEVASFQKRRKNCSFHANRALVRHAIPNMHVHAAVLELFLRLRAEPRKLKRIHERGREPAQPHRPHHKLLHDFHRRGEQNILRVCARHAVQLGVLHVVKHVRHPPTVVSNIGRRRPQIHRNPCALPKIHRAFRLEHLQKLFVPMPAQIIRQLGSSAHKQRRVLEVAVP